jgi:hypothetical protein
MHLDTHLESHSNWPLRLNNGPALYLIAAEREHINDVASPEHAAAARRVMRLCTSVQIAQWDSYINSHLGPLQLLELRKTGQRTPGYGDGIFWHSQHLSEYAGKEHSLYNLAIGLEYTDDASDQSYDPAATVRLALRTTFAEQAEDWSAHLSTQVSPMGALLEAQLASHPPQGT